MGPTAMRIDCKTCGSKFDCKGSSDCWCASVKTSKERFTALRAVTGDCVCPSCLLIEP